MNPAVIISSLRDRAIAGGFPVVLYRTVDPESDTLPLAVVLAHEEGREADPEVHGLVHRMIDVTVALVARCSDDGLIEALETAEALSAALVQVQPDVPDTLGAAGVNTLEVIETSAQTRSSSTDVFVVEVIVRATYNGASS